MSMHKLNDVTEIIMGQSPPSETYNDEGDGLPFFQGKADFGNVHPETRMYCSVPQKVAQTNDILMSVRAPVGAVNIANANCCIGRGLSAIRGSKKVYFKYLYYFFKAKEEYIASLGVGSTFKAISRKDLETLQIPLPPLPEQKRIAETLDRAQRLIDLRNKQIDEMDRLAQAVFIEMFGDPVRNEMGWEKVPFGSITEDFEAGWSIGGEQKELVNGEYGVLKVSAVTNGYFDKDEYKVFDQSIEIKRKITPRKGDLLFSRANTRELVGASCIVPADYPYLLLPDKLWRITFKKQIEAVFVKFVISYKSTRALLSNDSTGTSGSMYNISMDKLRNLTIPLPVYSIQKEFCVIINAVEYMKADMINCLGIEEQNYDILMQHFYA